MSDMVLGWYHYEVGWLQMAPILSAPWVCHWAAGAP